MIRIVLSSDHPFVRVTIRRMLSSEDDLEIVGEAGSIPETVQMCIEQQPDIVLIDKKAPGNVAAMHGLWKVACPQTGMIVLAAIDQPAVVLELLKGAVRGYLSYNETVDGILEAIYTVSSGGTWVSNDILLATQADPRDQSAGAPFPTQREGEVIQLLSEGFSNEQMAQHLRISERTIRFHLGNLMAKLHANNRTETVVAAIREGWIDPKRQPEPYLSETTG